MKYLAIAFGILLIAATAFAADVDGKWTGTMAEGPDQLHD